MWTGLGDVREQLGMFAPRSTPTGRAEAARAGRPVRPGPAWRCGAAGPRSRRGALHRGAPGGAGRGPPPGLRRHRAGPAGGRPGSTAFEAIVRQGQERPEKALVVARGPSSEAETRRRARSRWPRPTRHRLGAHRARSGRRSVSSPEGAGHLRGARRPAPPGRGAEQPRRGGLLRAATGTRPIDYYERPARPHAARATRPWRRSAAMNSGEILVNQGRLDEAEPSCSRPCGCCRPGIRRRAVRRAAVRPRAPRAGRPSPGRAAPDPRAAGRRRPSASTARRWRPPSTSAAATSSGAIRARRWRRCGAAQHAAKADAALYDVAGRRGRDDDPGRLDLLEEARASTRRPSPTRAARASSSSWRSCSSLAAAIDAERSGDHGPLRPVDEAVTILERAGLPGTPRLPARVAAGPARVAGPRGSPAP